MALNILSFDFSNFNIESTKTWLFLGSSIIIIIASIILIFFNENKNNKKPDSASSMPLS